MKFSGFLFLLFMFTLRLMAQPGTDDAVKLRLMMVDAMLELNQAMLEGVNASIDTLNLPENTSVIKEKDMQIILLRMKRARDKALLMPYFEQTRDSLIHEIALLKAEKEMLEARLKPAEKVQPLIVKSQTLVSKKDTLLLQTTIDTLSGEEQTRITNINTNEVIVMNNSMSDAARKKSEKQLKKYKNLIPIDTVVVFDVDEAPVAQGKQKKVKKEKSATVKSDANPVGIFNAKSEMLLKKALKEIQEKNFAKAEEYLTQSIKLSPNYFDAWYTLAEMDAENELTTKALSEYEKCATIDSNRSEVFYKMGILYLKNNRKKEALQCFNQAIEKNPVFIEALMQRAAIYTELKRLFDAIRDYDKIILADSRYYKAYLARGITKMSFRLYDDASEDFTRYLAFDPDNAEAYYYRALCHIGNNEIIHACLDLSVAIQKGYPTAEKAYNQSCK